ncbi:MAG: serine/threonine-protein kinase [Planctomycetota bacterium]
MTASRDDLLRHLLQRAMDLPPPARPAFVADKCGRDPELGRQLAAQLFAAGDAQFAPAGDGTVAPDATMLPPTPGGEAVGDEAEREQLGSRIGAYTLQQVIGEGGFGTVYLAEQREPVVRQVALKILKLGMDTRQVVARFEQERQALAVMDHPNIAKVLDAGATVRGRPYFVMELCRGEPLVEWCDKQRWPVAQRLELFVQICLAVQHAHGKGIIHRDLKPSNVLVGMQDGRPVVKVIDFGIAKALTQRLTERSLVTQAEQVIGTLQYMSPEQAEGSLDIDTRTDVYSLGVVLYELLTGSTPFDDPTQRRMSQAELIRRVRDSEPHKPSTRLSAAGETLAKLAERRRTDSRRLSMQLRGELDWIVMKAIERDRTRRYATALEFAQDVQRYLIGESVLAAPPSRVYRLRKFLGRYRAAVAGAACVFAALAVGAVAFAWQAAEARTQRDQARVEQRRAEDVASLMEDVFSGIDPNAERELGVTLADQLRQRLERSVAALASGDGDPITRARLQEALGSALMGLGEFARAEGLFRSALETRRQQLGERHPDTFRSAEELASAELRMGSFAAALTRLEQLRAAGGLADAGDLMLGMAYRAAGRRGEAILALERERDRLQRRGGADTEDGLLALHSLAACYREDDRAAAAVPLFEDVLARRIRLLGADHPDVLTTANSLAVALSTSGRREESLVLLEQTRARLLERYAPDHEAVVAIEANIANDLCKLRRAGEAVQRLEPLLARAAATRSASDPTLVRLRASFGNALADVGRWTDALPHMREVSARQKELFGPDSEPADDAAINLGRCLAQLRRPAEGIDVLRPVVARLRRLDEDAVRTLALRVELAKLLRLDDKLDEAIADLEDVLRRARAAHAGDVVIGNVLCELGGCYFQRHDAAAAIAAYEPAVVIRTRTLGAHDPGTLGARASLASSHWLAGDFERAIPMQREVLAAAARVCGERDRTTLGVALDLAVNLRDAHRDDELFAHLTEWLAPILRGGFVDGRTTGPMAQWFLRQCMNARFAAAVPVLEFQVEQLRERVAADDPGLLSLIGNLGSSYWFAKRLDKSVPLFEDLVARVQRVHGRDAQETLQQVYNLGVNLRDAGRAADALPWFADVVERVQRGELSEPGSFDDWLRQLAQTQVAAGQRDRAAQTCRDCLVHLRRAAGDDGARLASGLVNVGMLFLDLSMFDDAASTLQECVMLRERLQPTAWNTSYARVLLGAALHGLHRDDEARALLVRGCEELRAGAAAVPPPGRVRLVESVGRLLAFLADVGDDAAAEPWRSWREELRAVDGMR